MHIAAKTMRAGLGWLAGLAGLAVLCWLGFFQCPAQGFYSLLLILTAICTGFKSNPQKTYANTNYNLHEPHKTHAQSM